jgi:hypothetical protein
VTQSLFESFCLNEAVLLVVMYRPELENDVREVLARLLRVESNIATLSFNTNAAQLNQSSIISQVTMQVQQLQIEQRAHFHAFKVDLDASRSPSKILETPSKEASPDGCSFPTCKFLLSSKRPCSALMSLRHMRNCIHCPAGQCRYLSIALHMLAFRSPRVALINTCCWCGYEFKDIEDGDNPDGRTRHRKSCLLSTIHKLQCAEEHDATVQLLNAIWDQDVAVAEGTVVSPITPLICKRGRTEGSPNVVPLSNPCIVGVHAVILDSDACTSGQRTHTPFRLSDSDDDLFLIVSPAALQQSD